MEDADGGLSILGRSIPKIGWKSKHTNKYAG